MDRLKIKIILGSTRPSRFSEGPGHWILGEAQKRGDIDAELLDLREYQMPFFNEPVSSSSKKEPFTNEAVVRWSAKIAEADGFIIVTPEYNHGYPAVLKNALDYVYQEWNMKPVGFIAYGSTLGARAVGQLRQVAIELQLVPIRNSIHIPRDIFLSVRKEESPIHPELFKPLEERATGLLDQLVQFARILKGARGEKNKS